MDSEKFEEERNELFEKIQQKEELDDSLKEEIEDIYGKRGNKAIKVVENGGIEKRGEKWYVKGSNEKYEVVKKFCSCKDYVLNITTGKTDVDMCYHALAKNIYKILNNISD